MFTQSKTITFIVPAKDEQDNIINVLTKIKELGDYWSDFYVMMADDGSSDQTYELAQNYLEQNLKDKYKLVKNATSRNQGGVFKQFLKDLKTDYVMIAQGQDDMNAQNFIKVFGALDETDDMVIPYQKNWRERPLSRQIPSRCFVYILNVIFGLKLNYYNHSVLMKVKDVQDLEVGTSSYAFQAEIIIKLLRCNKSYKQVAVIDRFSHKSKSNAFKLKNIIGVSSFLFSMLCLRLFSNRSMAQHSKVTK